MTIQPQIMGVLNITPDSFSDGGKYFDFNSAIVNAKRMIKQGADIIDIGGESTRPGAKPVSTNDEIDRVIPIIEALHHSIDVPISIDTSKPEVMKLAVEAGASMINDVCALSADDALEAAALLNVNVCLMHMQGSPRTMQNSPVYGNVIDDIKQFFDNRIKACIDAGITEGKIILDPGFGFGKNLNHNLEILKRLSEFKSFGLPILAGISRKSMIGSLLNDRNVDGRVSGSVTAAIIAIENGANIVRVHDVLETKDALMVWQSVNQFKG
ncbi:dihydropteroate synthase [Candidatus Thioglobus sp.]|jgi:dihydropteroate synthase|uniref:dihydropteroate synthase n=1 Tax=Candidatus Thioglobus sp. TaxID=2026721 RepID=UPI003241CA7E